MDEFILIFRHEDGTKVASPEQMQIWMKQTMDWIGGIAARLAGRKIVRTRHLSTPVRSGWCKSSRWYERRACTAVNIG